MAYNLEAAQKNCWIVQLEALVPDRELALVFDPATPYSPSPELRPSIQFASIVKELIARGGDVVLTYGHAQNPDPENRQIHENLITLMKALRFEPENQTRNTDSSAERLAAKVVMKSDPSQIVDLLKNHDALNEDAMVVSGGINFVEEIRPSGTLIGFLISRDTHEALRSMNHPVMRDPNVQIATLHENFWLLIRFGWAELDRRDQAMQAKAEPASP